MDIQHKVQCLNNLLKDVEANLSEIISIYIDISKEKSPSFSDVKPFLNKSALHLLKPEVNAILKKHRLESFSYILVANNLLELEDVKDDLLEGHVLKEAFVPANTIKKMKTELGLLASQLQPQHSPTTTKEIVNPYRDEEKRLAIQIKNECCDIYKPSTGMDLYKLPIKSESTFSEANVKRYSFGDPSKQVKGSRLTKTILLMGATGSGKTTMINAMINYVLGVEWNDPFRFVLIKEDLQGTSQAFSQTRDVTAYDIYYREGFRIPYSLTIVDTPGFGDTGGIARDHEITSAVKKFFEHKNGIQELDAVGFVVQSSLVRLTTSQLYIFNSVLSIFGKDIEENVRFLVSFADGSHPPALEAIKQAELPCQKDSNGLPCHQSFNNNAIFVSSQKNDRRSRIDWEDGMDNFKLFFTELSKMRVKSLQLTKEVMFSRENLDHTISMLEEKIQIHLIKMEELRKTEEAINNYKDKVNANKDFEIKIPVPKKIKVKVENQTALNCMKCETTCHYPCDKGWDISWCPAFWRPADSSFLGVSVSAAANLFGFLPNSSSCKVCLGKCGTKHHKNEESKWAIVEEQQTKTLYEVRKKYDEAKQQTMSAKDLKKALNEEIEKLKQDIVNAMEVISYCSNELKKNALRGNPLTTPEYILLMIENEEQEKKPGYKEKVNNLKKLLNKAKIAQDIADGGELYRQFSLSN